MSIWDECDGPFCSQIEPPYEWGPPDEDDSPPDQEASQQDSVSIDIGSDCQSDPKPPLVPTGELAAPEPPSASTPGSMETPEELPVLPIADLPTPPKRRRLNCKTKVDQETHGLRSPSEGACSPYAGCSPLERDVYTKLYNQAKYKWLRQWVEDRPRGFWTKDVGWAQKLHKAREAFQTLPSSIKQNLFKDWQAVQSGSLQPLDEKEEEDYCQSNRVACITTEYAFSEDRFEIPLVKELGTELAALSVDSEAYQELLDKFKALPSVAADWDAFVSFCEGRTESTNATELSMSMEMSTHSDIPGRYHAHAVWSTLRGKPAPEERHPRLYFGKMSTWRFQGKTPHVVVNTKQGGRSMHKQVNRGHAYLQIRKRGKLFSSTNWSKGSSYVCDAQWVLQWWQLGKIGLDAAELEVIENKHRVEATLKQLWFHSEKVKQMALKKERLTVKALLADGLKRYKRFPKVNKWRAQYMPKQYGKRMRFKFLVLVGPSSLGKTAFAMHLYGVEVTYYTNCQNVSEPNLGGFQRGVHKAIVVDEAGPELVVKNKALFQCNAEGVSLQESRCQQSAIWRFLYFVPLIVCTNAWELAGLPAADSEWLNSNSEVLNLEERTWLE